jgi:hypothetical protein
MAHYALQRASAFVRPSTAAATLPGTLDMASPPLASPPILASPSIPAQQLSSSNSPPTALAAPLGTGDDASLGPYALLKKLFTARARVRIYLRRDQELRGYCDAHIKAFDKHLNMYVYLFVQLIFVSAPAHVISIHTMYFVRLLWFFLSIPCSLSDCFGFSFSCHTIVFRQVSL